jgi:hypothetical protein
MGIREEMPNSPQLSIPEPAVGVPVKDSKPEWIHRFVDCCCYPAAWVYKQISDTLFPTVIQTGPVIFAILHQKADLASL